MRSLTVLLLLLHVVVGIGALAGGWAAMTNPLEPLGAPLSLLAHSPFEDFFIPGVLLFFVIGGINMVSFILYFMSKVIVIYTSNIAGWALMIWIAVQVWMIQAIGFLHVVFFLIGVVQAGVAFLQLYQENLFPIPLLQKWFKR